MSTRVFVKVDMSFVDVDEGVRQSGHEASSRSTTGLLKLRRGLVDVEEGGTQIETGPRRR
jgi:hypothetical protein